MDLCTLKHLHTPGTSQVGHDVFLRNLAFCLPVSSLGFLHLHPLKVQAYFFFFQSGFISDFGTQAILGSSNNFVSVLFSFKLPRKFQEYCHKISLEALIAGFFFFKLESFILLPQFYFLLLGFKGFSIFLVQFQQSYVSRIYPFFSIFQVFWSNTFHFA